MAFCIGNQEEHGSYEEIHTLSSLYQLQNETLRFGSRPNVSFIGGIDGSTAQLPMSKEILTEFGGVTNQHGLVMAMGRISTMYDVLNAFTVDGIIAPYETGERELALCHFEALVAFDERTAGHRGHQHDLLLFDMGYPALWFMAYLIVLGKDFVIRTSEAFLKEVQEAISSAHDDMEIRIPIRKAARALPHRLKALVPEIDPSLELVIRVLKIRLEDGTQEELLTTLLDAEVFPYEAFQGLYARRWGHETNYDGFKNILEIENFTGLSALSVRQDFYATVLTNNIRALIHWELQAELETENQEKPRKYQDKLNTNLSIGRLKDRIVILILEQGDLQAFYADLKREMKRNMVPIRPGRRFPRARKNHQKDTLTKKRAL
jgi:hypothetical protein